MKKLAALILVAGLAVQGMAGPRSAGATTDDEQQREQIQTQTGAAQQYLSQLADKMKGRRKRGGTIGIIAGGLGMAGGIVLVGLEDDEADLSHPAGIGLMVFGGALAVASLITLGTPSRPEKEQARVGAISDAARREKAAAEALADLSRRGKNSRMFMGGIGSAAAVLSSLAANGEAGSGYYVFAGLLGAAAVYYFLVKSPEEKAYAAYSASSRVRPAPQLVIGLAPRGGIQVGFHLSF